MAASSAAAAAAEEEETTMESVPEKASGGGSMLADEPWVEKYRPIYLDDIVGNTPIVERLKAIAEQGNMNNIILAGPPGTGKTTSIMCLARALLGASVLKQAVLELNASDERGIDVVRNRIKMFAQKKVSLPPGRHKIVILDEADSMTSSAQQALRRTMEIYSTTTRFALACNNSTKIIEPIQSRCAVLRYGKLKDEEILKRLQEVCEAEGVHAERAGLEAILFTSDGDMRNALNNLQSTFSGFGRVTDELVFKVCDQPHPMTVREILQGCFRGDVDAALQKLQALWNDGYSALDVIGTLFRVARSYEGVDEALLLEFLREIGLVHMRIASGSTTLLQLQGLVARLCRIATPPKSS